MENKDTKWLKKLHNSELKILDELDRICQKNNIDYFLTGGTLLGAVRHKDFIPWDDDIDVGMTREDFNKFVKCCKKGLKDDFFLDFYPINKRAFRLYAKLRLKNTLFVESKIKDCHINHEIWIDIFPYDNLEELNSREHQKQNDFRIKVTKLINLKVGIKYYLSQYRQTHHVTMFFVDLFLKICPKSFLLFLANHKISTNKNNKTKYISNMTGGLDIEKETHLRSDIFPLVRLEFAGGKYLAPKNYDKILRKVYGNYMELPPLDKRITHNPQKVLFEDGTIINFEEGEAR